MSVVPIGCANDAISMYEDNTPIISTGNVLTGLQDTPMPPDTTLDYTEIQARSDDPGDTGIIVYLVDVTIQFQVESPVGQTDASQIIIIIAGDPDTPNYDRDILREDTARIYGGESIKLVQSICGIVKVQKNQQVDIRIARVGGNPAVVWTFQGAWTKYKRLD
jgi:hypothetical protein